MYLLEIQKFLGLIPRSRILNLSISSKFWSVHVSFISHPHKSCLTLWKLIKSQIYFVRHILLNLLICCFNLPISTYNSSSLLFQKYCQQIVKELLYNTIIRIPSNIAAISTQKLPSYHHTPQPSSPTFHSSQSSPFPQSKRTPLHTVQFQRPATLNAVSIGPPLRLS